MGDWISAEEAQELSGYHIETIYQHCRQGLFQAQKRGSWWIDKRAFQAFLEERGKETDGRYGPKKR